MRHLLRATRLRLLAAALAATVLPQAAVAQEHAPSLPALIEQSSPSVVTIEVADELGQVFASGSGFYIEADVVVTNFHVIEGATSATIHGADGKFVKATGLLAEDRVADLVLLAVERGSGRPLKLNTTLPKPGEPVLVMGSPQGLEQSASNGIVSAVREFGKYGTVIQTTAPVSSGNSGGPLIGQDGAVVGVVTFKRVGGENLNFAIPAARVASLSRSPVRAFATVIPRIEAAEVEVPAAFLDRVSVGHQKLIEKLRPWFIRLPDGRCIDAMRVMAARHIHATGTAWRGLPDDLEAYGIESRTTNARLFHEGLPPWYEPFAGGLICSGIPEQASLRIHSITKGNEVIASVEGGAIETGLMIVQGLPAGLMAPSRYSQGLLLWKTDQIVVDGRTYDVVQAYPLDDRVATAAELAFALYAGKASLRLYSADRREHQPLTRIKTGRVMNPYIVSKSGPLEVTYKWQARPVKIAIRGDDESMPEDSPNESVESPDDDREQTVNHVEPQDCIVLRDGRRLSGTLVSQDATEVVFLVMVGRIQSEMRFQRREVDEVVLGTRP